MFYGRKNESILITVKFNLLFPSPYEMNALGRSSFQDLFQGDPGD